MKKPSAIKNEHYRWGVNCEGWILHQSETLGIKKEMMPLGSSEITHFHLQTEQVFYILEGTARLNIEGEFFEIEEGMCCAVPVKTYHTISNASDANLIFLLVSQPPVLGDRFEIVEFSEGNEEPIKVLNFEWLQKHFRVESNDMLQLSNPKSEIIDKGGKIFYLKTGNSFIGTTSLLKIIDTTFELGKMAITEKFQGSGVGSVLLKYCLHQAKLMKIEKLILYSNTKLKPAIHLYQKFGFTEVAMEPGHYERANIKMELIIS